MIFRQVFRKVKEFFRPPVAQIPVAAPYKSAPIPQVKIGHRPIHGREDWTQMIRRIQFNELIRAGHVRLAMEVGR